MRKVRKPYYRKDRRCWMIYWLVDGRQRGKAFPNKQTAEAFQARKIHQLNEDIWPDPVALTWAEVTGEFLRHKQLVQRRAPDTLRIFEDTLEHFRKINGPIRSTQLAQRHIDAYVVHRLEKIDGASVNKELRALRTFVNWASHRNRRYLAKPLADGLEWPMQDLVKKQPRSLTLAELGNLCIAAKKRRHDYYIRVLLAAVTGLRRGDIDRLHIADINFEVNTIYTRSRKKKKERPNRPVPGAVLIEVQRYIETLKDNEARLFPHQYQHKDWVKIRSEAGVRWLKFHDLRVTFASLLAQLGVNQSVVQNLLEHESADLTHKIYTDVSPVYRAAVESIPLDGLTNL